MAGPPAPVRLPIPLPGVSGRGRSGARALGIGAVFSAIRQHADTLPDAGTFKAVEPVR